MTTIFKTPISREPLKEDVNRELNAIIDRVNKSIKDKPKSAVHPFNTDEELNVFCMNECIRLVLGIDVRKVRGWDKKNTVSKTIATKMYVDFLGFKYSNSCKIFKITRGTYYKQLSDYSDVGSTVFLRESILKKYNQLLQYFKVDVNKEIKNPVTVTYKSKV